MRWAHFFELVALSTLRWQQYRFKAAYSSKKLWKTSWIGKDYYQKTASAHWRCYCAWGVEIQAKVHHKRCGFLAQVGNPPKLMKFLATKAGTTHVKDVHLVFKYWSLLNTILLKEDSDFWGLTGEQVRHNMPQLVWLTLTIFGTRKICIPTTEIIYTYFDVVKNCKKILWPIKLGANYCAPHFQAIPLELVVEFLKNIAHWQRLGEFLCGRWKKTQEH